MRSHDDNPAVRTPHEAEATLALTIRRVIGAPRERVFAALTNPAVLKEWAAPAEHRLEHVEADVRVGGRYRRHMRFPDGALHVLAGVYREVDPPRRLVYTFAWETVPELGETLVTVELVDYGEATELTVVHEGILDAAMGEDYGRGWEECIDKLELVLGSAAGGTARE